MPFTEAILLALETIRTSKLRSFFTLLGIIVSVGFLVAVVAIIQGMNSYVRDNLRSSMIGTNTFQVRRTPLVIGFLDDSMVREIAKRPRITREDAERVREAFPDAEAVSLQSGWPAPIADINARGRTLGSVTVFGVTPEYQVVQDYKFVEGEPLNPSDLTDRRPVVAVGSEVAEKLFDYPGYALGQTIRIGGRELTIKGVIAPKGRVLGQSFDGFVLMPITTFESIYGRRLTTTISIKLRPGQPFPEAMGRAEEAMRLAHRLRPNEPDDFALDKADALVAFWTSLTQVLFTLIPAVVGIGIVVGGHRDHEHHADVGERADPGNRDPEIAGRAQP